MYLASKIHKELNIHFSQSDVIGKDIPYGEISKRLNKILHPMGAKIRVNRDPLMKIKKATKRQPYSFSGWFDTSRKKNAIVLNMHFSPSRKSFKFTKKNYSGFIFMFSQIVQHEFIHQSQYAFRPEQSDRIIKVHYSDKISRERVKEIEYLSTWCEVEAYAHDIAMEIKYYYGNLNPENVIKQIDNYRKLYSYLVYKKAFKGLEWNRLKKSLLRKIWRWIPSAQGPQAV